MNKNKILYWITFILITLVAIINTYLGLMALIGFVFGCEYGRLEK